MKKPSIDIIYEDEALLLVSKPAGVLTIPDRYHPEYFNLMHHLSETFGKVWVVHRLDKETSGIVCFARTEEAHRHLSDQFEKRQVQKIYLALLEGRLASDEGNIDKPIGPHPGQPGKMMVTSKGKQSLTTYKVLERFRHFTLVEADIKTGRTHQIRVHFSSINHPLAVDAMYGKRQAFLLSEVKTRQYQLGTGQEEQPLLSRTSLHAYRLVIRHPKSGKVLDYSAPVPKDLQAVIKQLRKWGN